MNNILCFIFMLDPTVVTDLLYTYCGIFYGSVLWNLKLPEIQFNCLTWQTALQRLWNTLHNTHNDTICALCGNLPLFDELCCRVINFDFHWFKKSK